MAITRAQQVRQMLKDGKRVGFFTAGLAAGDNISPGTSTSGGQRNNGGNGNNNYQDRIQRIAEQKKREKKAADERAARNRENKRIATVKENKRLKEIKERKEKEKRDREEKDRIIKEKKDLSNLGKSTTTKFGTTTKPGTRSSKKTGIATSTIPNRFLTNTYLDERKGYVDQFGNPIGNTLDAKFASLSTPTKTTDGTTSVVNNVPEGIATADDIREQYGILRSTTPKNQEIDFNDVFEAAVTDVDRTGISQLQEFTDNQRKNRYTDEIEDLFPEDKISPQDFKLSDTEKLFQDFKDTRNEVKAFGPLTAILKNPLQKFADISAEKNRKFFEKVVRAGKIPGVNLQNLGKFDLEKAYKDYLSDRSMGKIDAYGNTLGNFRRENIGGQSVIMGSVGGGDGGNNNIIPISSTNTSSLTPVEETVDNRTELEKLIDARGAAYRFFADGGRVPAMAGGIMNTDVIGGAADGNIDEMGRQMYFVGKLVKKATRAVKKIAKSPIGKAALLYGLGAVGGSLGAGKGLFSKGMFNLANMKAGLFGQAMKPGFAGPGIPGLFNKLGLTKTAGSLMPTALGGITLASLSPFLFQGEEEEETPQDKGPSIDIAAIRRDPYKYMGEAYRFAADGGLMRTGYAEGSKEPVAKKTMPLIDMDGKEMDLRDEGGFVPLGRMERADDVPARLSKNEFVFTADAVRNAGEGDIDKGAEVMYNMMKNLESGGEVSEESQGLDGAREMFKTSQRLGEVV